MGSSRFLISDEIIDFLNDYTVIDIETTGLSSKNDCITEVAAAKVRNGEVVDVFNSLVKSNKPLVRYGKNTEFAMLAMKRLRGWLMLL